MQYQIQYATFTDAGTRPGINQDAVYCCCQDTMAVFCVTDGMGGHAHGELASAVLTEGIAAWAEKTKRDALNSPFRDVLDSLEACIGEINRKIYIQLNCGQICGATAAVFLIVQEYCAVLSAGDSRVYRQSGFRFRQITRDDVWQNQSADPEALSEKRKKEHPDYGKLTKAVGVRDELVLSVRTDVLKTGDIYLLCSDGVYKVCGTERMKRACLSLRLHGRQKDIHGAVDSLQRHIVKMGAPDNYSMIFVKIGK